jgi:hypothetical protein
MSDFEEEFQEEEFGRIAGLGHGEMISLGLVFTNMRIIQLDYRAQIIRLWAGGLIGVAAWLLVFISLLTFLFTLLREIVVVIGFGLLPILIVLIRRNLGKNTKPKISGITRDRVTRVVFKKPGTVLQRGRFRVILANGESFDFWTSGRAKFEAVKSALQAFCSWPPIIPLIESSPTDTSS